MPTTATATSITSTIQKLEATYAPETASAAHRAALAYVGNLATLEAISVLLTAAFVVGIVVIVRKTGWLRIRLERIDDVVFKADHAKRFVERSWSEVERHFFAGDDSDLKIAIIKADTLLDEALREAGVRGADIGDRLRQLTPSELPNLEHVWEAHKLRNRIAHEATFALKRDLAERALTVYEEALEHLGVLEKLPPTGTGSALNSDSGSGSGSGSRSQ